MLPQIRRFTVDWCDYDVSRNSTDNIRVTRITSDILVDEDYKFAEVGTEVLFSCTALQNSEDIESVVWTNSNGDTVTGDKIESVAIGDEGAYTCTVTANQVGSETVVVVTDTVLLNVIGN